jgi:hypothetical protein
MCALTRVSRAGFYRRGVISEAASVELRDQVQRVALEWPTYGSRRVTAELRRGGLSVNRKRVQRLMREDNPARGVGGNTTESTLVKKGTFFRACKFLIQHGEKSRLFYSPRVYLIDQRWL